MAEQLRGQHAGVREVVIDLARSAEAVRTRKVAP
jgi:hypothetical protein